VVGEPDLEQPGDGEGSDLWIERPVGRGARQQDRHAVARLHRQLGREHPAKHHVPRAWRELLQRTGDHRLRQVARPGLVRWQDAADRSGGQAAARRQESLEFHVGRSADDVLRAAGRSRQLLEAGLSRPFLRQRGVRRQRQQPVPQLALEAVHHGQDRDQRGHAKADPGERHPGDEGHEEGPPARTDVTQPDAQREGCQHGRLLNHTAATQSRNREADQGFKASTSTHSGAVLHCLREDLT
jgi:hypothetical protein